VARGVPESFPVKGAAFGASDAARRCSEIVNQAVLDGYHGRTLAIRLSDGGSDKVPYDTREAAIRHQLHPTQCAYVAVPRDGMSPAQADRYLALMRAVYDEGYRPDQDNARHEILLPNTIEETRCLLNRSTRRR
jgi:hypothetical protein